MNDDEIYKAIKNMNVYGGGFARGLAMLYQLADWNNKKKLLECFKEVFEKYAHFGERFKGDKRD